LSGLRLIHSCQIQVSVLWMIHRHGGQGNRPGKTATQCQTPYHQRKNGLPRQPFLSLDLLILTIEAYIRKLLSFTLNMKNDSAA
jgi:hypothetical protein